MVVCSTGSIGRPKRCLLMCASSLCLLPHLITASLIYDSRKLGVVQNQTLISVESNADEVGDTYTSPPRVIFEPFLLNLQKTDSALSVIDLEYLHGVMETVVFDYMSTKSTERRLQADESITLEYVKFGSIEQELDSESEALIVSVEAGVARYSGHPTPESAVVNGLMRDSLQSNLVDYLKTDQRPPLDTFESVAFELQNPPPAPTPNNPAGARTVDVVEDSGGSDKAKGAIVGGSLAAAVCVIALLALAVTRRRSRRQVVKIEDMNAVDDNRKQEFTGNADLEAGSNRRALSDDGRSVAEGSESDWTVATEAGDTTGLKSIQHSSLEQQPRSTCNTPEHKMVLSESFERDRQVAITKDMLTGQWSGRVSNARGGNIQSESVLQPSHFSASQERRTRKAAAEASSPPTAGETSSASSDSQAGDDESGVRFEPWGNQLNTPPKAGNRKAGSSQSGLTRQGSGEIL